MKKSKDIVLVGDTLVSLFKLYDTTGLPVDMAIHLLQIKNLNVSIPHFIVDARQAKWSEEKITTLLTQVCKDLQLSVSTLNDFIRLPPTTLERIVSEWNKR